VHIIFLSINNIPTMSMSQFEYSALTENSSDDQSDTNSNIHMNITPKSKKTSKLNVKRQKKNMELKSSKKIKTEKVVSYKDKLDLIISSKKCDNIITNVSDSISIKQGEKTCTFKSPTTAGDDYWVIQHYKTKEILNVSPQEK